MVDGPIFSDTPVGGAVQPCRTGAGKAKHWDLPCVLKILCKNDKDTIDYVNKHIKLYKVDRVYFQDNYFDGKSWTLKLFEAGGTSGGGEITFLTKDSCENAASTLYHETWHAKQPPGLDWPHPNEDDAYYNTELWTIANGLPGQDGADGLRTKDAKGKVVPDKKAIATYVDDAYPVPPPAPPGWRIANLDKAKNQTQWHDGVSGKDVWKTSAKGDTVPGPQITKGKALIPSKSVKCP